jgi:hypothetical protein
MKTEATREAIAESRFCRNVTVPGRAGCFEGCLWRYWSHAPLRGPTPADRSRGRHFGFYPLLAPTPHRIDQAHFELIQNGLTRADVEAIFGVPPGQHDWAEPESLHKYGSLFRTVYWMQTDLALQRQPGISFFVRFPK